MRRLIASALTAFMLTGSAMAQDAGTILADSLYAGTIAKGQETLAPAVETGDADALMASGVLKFFAAVEGFSQAMYTHGLAPDLRAAELLIGVGGAPRPINPSPEPLDYAGVRAILADFVSGLDAAKVDLLAASETVGDTVFLLEPVRFRIDYDGDGTGSDNESVARIFSLDPSASSIAPQDREATMPDFVIGFDKADAIWLAGYSQIIAAHADFLLAHDFKPFTDAFFQRLFPEAGFPMQDYDQGSLGFMGPNDSSLGDAIAAIHNLNWEVTDKARLAGVLDRLNLVIDLSGRNWDAILAETDDNRELVPSPTQTSLIPDATVTEATVAAWRETLAATKLVLGGELLVPHWRFDKGFDLKAYFTTADRTDFVLIFGGLGALPYLRDGPIASATTFRAAGEVFGDNFFNYAFWFN